MYLKDAFEFSGKANRVLVQIFPWLEFALFTIHKGLPAIEIVWRERENTFLFLHPWLRKQWLFSVCLTFHLFLNLESCTCALSLYLFHINTNLCLHLCNSWLRSARQLFSAFLGRLLQGYSPCHRSKDERRRSWGEGWASGWGTGTVWWSSLRRGTRSRTRWWSNWAS